MECNKDKAKKAMYIAKKKLSENDCDGAKGFINKAEILYPNKLDGLKQALMMINVYIAAASKIISMRKFCEAMASNFSSSPQQQQQQCSAQNTSGGTHPSSKLITGEFIKIMVPDHVEKFFKKQKTHHFN